MEYTKEMIAELKSKEQLSYEDAKKFSDRYGVSIQSVIGKARALDVDYVKKGGNKSKSGKTKADWVAGIETLAGRKFRRLEALVLEDLEILFDVLDGR